jgi:hypothetical protein
VGLDRGEANSAAHTLRASHYALARGRHRGYSVTISTQSDHDRGLPNAEKQASYRTSYRKRHLGKNGEKNARCSFSTPSAGVASVAIIA